MFRRPSIISPSQLKALKPKSFIPIDASWKMPGSAVSGKEDFLRERIPSARFFDLDEVALDHPLGLKHMLPSAEQFGTAAGSLGITPETHLVFYDSTGIFSSPRAAFTFASFNHPGKLSILDGGFPRWKAEGHEIEQGAPPPHDPAAYPTPEVLTEDATIPYERIVSNAKIDPRARQAAVVLDARAYPRFTGEAPEPRPGLPSGHIPNSKSLPFSELVVDGKLLGDEELRAKIGRILGADAEAVFKGEKKAWASCGSGMTAATIWLALQRLGVEASIYDESWTGYAQRKESKIAKGK